MLQSTVTEPKYLCIGAEFDSGAPRLWPLSLGGGVGDGGHRGVKCLGS